MGASSTDTNLITFKSFKLGSVNINGYGTPISVSSSSVVSSTTSLSSGLASGSLGGFSVTSSTIVSNGVVDTSSTSNLSLIVGLSVGIPIFISKFLSI